ncbi:26S proteasome regulatory subunit rpn6 [Cymbomonas tetramitiformis]|uniref:26S proteasome regulatory subunit rpn6 n=1 Tax=Cymbomonas tetramitiformis TaxID=36881 RepID=A0AAE0C2F9_9CHLO|nr:26S proteasome regulatory subunit rpn6 [Cymbomonas tetramitiformis]|eukprot:gene20826-24963_t
MAAEMAKTLDDLEEIMDARPAEALEGIRNIVFAETSSDAETLKVKEQAIQKLTELLTKQKEGGALHLLLTELRPLFSTIPKAKTAKIVRSVIDAVSKIPGTVALQVELCKEQVAWATQEKRTFLRQRIEARLGQLYLETKEYPSALTLIGTLLSEVKRLDDKLLLVDVHLLESRVHHALRNLPKAKAALTAARTAANSIYVPPNVQCQIDMQSGVLHAEEKDYKTGYSYFYEAFEQFNSLDDPKAVQALKYMLLCKIMTDNTEDVSSIINTKGGLKHVGVETEAMKAVAHAHIARSLQSFQEALKNYDEQLGKDAIIHSHLSALYEKLMEQNLCRLIEPFNCVEIAHLAQLIELPVQTVESKLSQMILDKKFAGILDQGKGVLLVFEDAPVDKIFTKTVDTIKNMSRVVDSLFVKSKKIVTV